MRHLAFIFGRLVIARRATRVSLSYLSSRWKNRVSARFAIYDPDLAFVQERTALAHAMFHSVASHLRQTYAATKELHSISSLKLKSSRLAKNRAAADRLRSARSRDAEWPTLKIAAS